MSAAAPTGIMAGLRNMLHLGGPAAPATQPESAATPAAASAPATQPAPSLAQRVGQAIGLVSTPQAPVARQEVPGEVLLANYDADSMWSTRAYAMLGSLEGSARLTAQVFWYLYDKFFNSGNDAERQWDIVLAQWESLKFCLYAILSPSSAVEGARTAEGGPRLLGVPENSMRWGTPHNARADRTISTWKVWSSNLRA